MNTTSAPDQLFGADVLDSSGNKIGTVDNVWVDDATNDTEFIGVKTGWLMGHTHLIPTAEANFGDGQITVPYDEDQIKNAPSFSADHELSPDEESQVYSYYNIDRQTSTSPTGLPGGSTDTTTSTGTAYADTTGTSYTDTNDTYTNTTDTPEVTLSEEELQVGKRQVQAGTVRLRKVVNTEHQEVPVELNREQVEIERVDVSDTNAPTNAFQDQEIEVPVMTEEPVVGKETRVTGAVRLNKTVETETRTVGGDVRSEDVEVDRDADTTTYAESSTGTTTDSTNY
jgi:uncharacterized protein (TIGR02271 family)